MKTNDVEVFDEVDAAGTSHTTHIRSNGHWGYTKPLESIEDNSINSELIPPPDLSNDIYINQLLSDSGAPTNPDAEVFEVLNGQMPPQVSRKTVALNYLPPQKHNFIPNEPASDFSRVGIQPGYTNNMPFMPQPMFPVNHAIPNMRPNDFYVRPPNFPVFQPHLPTNQMYFPHYIPIEQNLPPIANYEQHQPISTHSAVGLKGTTLINENDFPSSNAPVNTVTDSKNPTTAS